MNDRVPPTPPQPSNEDGSGLPPGLLKKLKVEIDGYELIERLGEGGQATVYRAIQKKDGRTVAVKVLHAGPHATEEARSRLKREINALRAIDHPNIVHAIAAGRTRSGLDCLVMNFIDGRPLDALWTDQAFTAAVAPKPADLLRLYKTICETVQAAHRKGITHRDLSPSNILIDAKGQPHILDFGMASTAFDGIVTRNVTVTGQFIGKLKYASPEQAKGTGSASDGVDIRSDVYALGVMLYQLLTGGAFPYEVVGNVIDVLHNIVHSRPKPPSEVLGSAALRAVSSSDAGISPAKKDRQPIRRNPPLVNETIEAIVLKALEKDPEKRFQSAGELAADIDRYLAGQPTSAAAWSRRPKLTSSFGIRRRPVLAIVSITLVATLLGVAMNAKSLAVWLGISAVVAPVLPGSESLVGPKTAQATGVSNVEPREGGDGQLNSWARDLSRKSARLRAIHEKLSETFSRKSPELEAEPASSSGLMNADKLIEVLTKYSNETGRDIKFELPGKEATDSEFSAQAEKLAPQTEEKPVLDARAEFDVQQAILWAQLSWGTFTGRTEEPLYRFQLKTPSTPNANLLSKSTLIEKGIRVRRIAAEAMNKGILALETGRSSDGVDLAPLTQATGEIANQLKDALSDFQTAIRDAKDKGVLSNEEREQVDGLSKHAESLRDAAVSAPSSCRKASKATDEQDRFTTRGDLQKDLLGSGEAAARLDQALVAAAKGWGMEPDTGAERKSVVPPAAKSKQEAPEAKPIEKKKTEEAQPSKWSAWTVGSTWFATKPGNMRAETWRVTARTGNRIELDVKYNNPRASDIVIAIVAHDDGNVVVEKISPARDTGNEHFRKWSGQGTITEDSLTLQYTFDWQKRNGDWIPTENRIELHPLLLSIAEIFPIGKKWSGTSTNEKGQKDNITAVVKELNGNRVTLEMTNSVWTRPIVIELNGGTLKLISIGVGHQANGRGTPREIVHIEMTGTYTNSRMTWAGKYDGQRRGKVTNTVTETVELEREN